jgi:hypothetical protein
VSLHDDEFIGHRAGLLTAMDKVVRDFVRSYDIMPKFQASKFYDAMFPGRSTSEVNKVTTDFFRAHQATIEDKPLFTETVNDGIRHILLQGFQIASPADIGCECYITRVQRAEANSSQSHAHDSQARAG